MLGAAVQLGPVVDGGAPKLVAIEIIIADVHRGLDLFVGSPLKASPRRLWRLLPWKCGPGV